MPKYHYEVLDGDGQHLTYHKTIDAGLRQLSRNHSSRKIHLVKSVLVALTDAAHKEFRKAVDDGRVR